MRVQKIKEKNSGVKWLVLTQYYVTTNLRESCPSVLFMWQLGLMTSDVRTFVKHKSLGNFSHPMFLRTNRHSSNVGLLFFDRDGYYPIVSFWSPTLTPRYKQDQFCALRSFLLLW